MPRSKLRKIINHGGHLGFITCFPIESSITLFITVIGYQLFVLLKEKLNVKFFCSLSCIQLLREIDDNFKKRYPCDSLAAILENGL